MKVWVSALSLFCALLVGCSAEGYPNTQAALEAFTKQPASAVLSTKVGRGALVLYKRGDDGQLYMALLKTSAFGRQSWVYGTGPTAREGNDLLSVSAGYVHGDEVGVPLIFCAFGQVFDPQIVSIEVKGTGMTPQRVPVTDGHWLMTINGEAAMGVVIVTGLAKDGSVIFSRER